MTHRRIAEIQPLNSADSLATLSLLLVALSLLLVTAAAAEAAQQFGALALGQAAERLRVSDTAVGEDPAGLDRADLRERQENVAHSRRPHALGRLGDDLREFDLPRR